MGNKSHSPVLSLVCFIIISLPCIRTNWPVTDVFKQNMFMFLKVLLSIFLWMIFYYFLGELCWRIWIDNSPLLLRHHPLCSHGTLYFNAALVTNSWWDKHYISAGGNAGTHSLSRVTLLSWHLLASNQLLCIIVVVVSLLFYVRPCKL